MTRHHRLHNLLPCIACAVAVLANLAHLALHGTPLDGGSLEHVFAGINQWAASLVAAPVADES